MSFVEIELVFKVYETFDDPALSQFRGLRRREKVGSHTVRKRLDSLIYKAVRSSHIIIECRQC